MEEIVSPKDDSACLKLLRRSDCSTDVGDRSSLNAEQCLSACRFQSSFNFFSLPITPKSDLFLQPSESPGYNQLNICLQEYYIKLEEEVVKPCFTDQTDKIIEVKNTASSSLLQRRSNNFSLRTTQAHFSL